ncbi:hypothetical protein N752_23950 [Desulforamulus aquiferis]|nr:universal stress protein [Desulforamulus aquiferis]RYD02388.1 hypothetical protein N752_23950 [Desulforamulus aquiferis]
MSARILFITDGSPSSMAAAETAIEFASFKNAILHVVFILDQGWRNLLGDE